MDRYVQDIESDEIHDKKHKKYQGFYLLKIKLTTTFGKPI